MVLDLIKERTSSDFAIKSGELQDLTGKSKVQIRGIVNDLRCKGEPICSGVMGYYYSNNYENLNNTICNLRSRITHIQEAINGLEKIIKNYR